MQHIQQQLTKEESAQLSRLSLFDQKRILESVGSNFSPAEMKRESMRCAARRCVIREVCRALKGAGNV